METILSLIKVTGLIFVLFGLCANYLVDTWQHSITAAVYIATLLCTDLTEKRTSNILQELPFYDHSDLLSTSRSYITAAFIIPFSILSVLDHGDKKTTVASFCLDRCYLWVCLRPFRRALFGLLPSQEERKEIVSNDAGHENYWLGWQHMVAK